MSTEYKLNPSASFATNIFGDVTAPIATEEDRYLKIPLLIFTWSCSAIGSLQLCLRQLELLSKNTSTKKPELLKKRQGVVVWFVPPPTTQFPKFQARKGKCFHHEQGFRL